MSFECTACRSEGYKYPQSFSEDASGRKAHAKHLREVHKDYGKPTKRELREAFNRHQGRE